MPLTLDNLRTVGIGAIQPGGTLAAGSRYNEVHHYITNDTAAVVEAAGYFNGAVKLLGRLDVIEVVAAAGGTPVLKRYVVTGNTGTVVTVALQTVAAG